MVLSNMADFLGLGAPEMILVLVILLLLFGAKKLPELARSVGQSAKELRKGMGDGAGQEKESSASKEV